MSDETPPAAAPAAKPTAVELVKTASNFLAGDIAKELVDGAPGFGKPSIQLLKNHGTYQQDDREQRKAKEGAKSVREISFMIRTCVPGGKLTADQLLAAIDLGDEVGNGTIRLTTRQSMSICAESPAAESRHVAGDRERRQGARGCDRWACGRRSSHGGLL